MCACTGAHPEAAVGEGSRDINRCQLRVKTATWMAIKVRSDRECLYVRTKFHENLSVDPECM